MDSILSNIEELYKRKEIIKKLQSILYQKQLYGEIKLGLSNKLTEIQKHKISNLYVNFLHYFAEFLVEYNNIKEDNKKKDYPLYNFKFSDPENPVDYFSKLNTLDHELLFYWDCWKKEPSELYKLFHKFLNSPNYTVIPSEPHISQESYDNEIIRAAMFDDGITFFSFVIDKPLTDPSIFNFYGTNGKCIKQGNSNIINKNVQLDQLVVPVVPFIWYREEEMLCPIRGIKKVTKKYVKDTYNYDIDTDPYKVKQDNILKGANLYICLHSLMYYIMKGSNENLLIIPNSFNVNKKFQVKIIPLKDSKIIEIPNGLKINEFVSGSVFIHDTSFSPPGTLHFKVDEDRHENEFICLIKCDELNINMSCLFILTNDF